MRVLKLSLLFTLSLFFGAVVASNFMGGEEADASEGVLLTTKNHVQLVGGINPYTISIAMKDLAFRRANYSGTIYLVIDSPGGRIDSGMNFLSFAKHIPNVKTLTLEGASMAHAIAQAMPGERLATEYTIMMAHRARGSVSGQFESGELEQRLAMWKKIVRKMEQTNADRMQISLDEYKKRVKDEWWSFGQDLIKDNMVDRIVPVKCSALLVEKDRCPLIR